MKRFLILSFLVASTLSIAAQPAGGHLRLHGPDSGYVLVPHHADLNPSAGITFEAWVWLEEAPATCQSLAGKQWTSSWWVGVCNAELRSYFRGSSSLFDSGSIALRTWTHIAATSDGITRKHYINGVLTGSHAETGPPLSSTAEMRIGSDISFNVAPLGAMDDVRLWDRALTAAEIVANMADFSSIRKTAGENGVSNPHPGLIVWYEFEGNADSSIGLHHGTIQGTQAEIVFPQPIGGYLHLTGQPDHSFVSAPGHPGLNPTEAITFEALVRLNGVQGPQTCVSIAGKDYTSGWWVGVCNQQLRSYFQGFGSAQTGGRLKPDVWYHIAASIDGTTHRHYLNGLEVAAWDEEGSPAPSVAEMRIGSDVSWEYTPAADIDEVRLWDYARSGNQLEQGLARSSFGKAGVQGTLIADPLSGMLVWYRFSGSLDSDTNSNDGAITGTGAYLIPGRTRLTRR